MDEYLLSDGTSGAFGVYSSVPSAAFDACVESFNAIGADGYAAILQPPNFAFPDGGPPIAGVNAFLPPYSADTCDGYQYQERNQKSTSLEARIASSGEGSLRWMGGVYYAHLEREVVVAYGADLGLGFEKRPYVGPDGRNPTDQLFWDDFETDVYSVFGQIESRSNAADSGTDYEGFAYFFAHI